MLESSYKVRESRIFHYLNCLNFKGTEKNVCFSSILTGIFLMKIPVFPVSSTGSSPGLDASHVLL